MKSMIVLIIAMFLLIPSCVPFGTYQALANAGPSEFDISDKRLEMFLEALEQQDRKKVKSMFSNRAIKETESFEDQLDYLFEFFQGEVLSWERKGVSIAEERDSGWKKKRMNSWYQVNTDSQSYLFILIECLENSKNADDIGIYTLRVIRAEDEEKEFSSWEAVEKPGIYKPD